VVKMNGRWFGGQQVEALLYAGKQRYKRSGAGEGLDDAVEGTTDEAEKKRLDNFAQWLMSEGD
jgi:HIV Tat-specific factor 1